VLDSSVAEASLRRAIADASDHIVISTTVDGIITSWNRAAERVYGYPREDMIGRSVITLIPPDRMAEEDAMRARVLAGDAIYDIVTRRRCADGRETPVALSLVPIRTDEGDIIGVLRLARDETGREHAQRASRRLAAIVESSDDAIISKDLNGIVTSWNQAAEAMFGYTAAEMIGRSIRTIIPDHLQSEEDHVLSRIRSGERVDHFETIRRRKDGTMLNVSLTVSPIRDLDGRIIGASKIARDISERKRADIEREKLHEVGAIVSATLDRSTIVQAVTDIATQLTEAEFGAFLYDTVNEHGESHQRYTISGAPHEALAIFPKLRDTELVAATLGRAAIVRSQDIRADPRYRTYVADGVDGQLPIRSYLAVPVKAPSGEVFGGLFFAHPLPNRFDDRHQRLATGVASWASVALENARLYVSIQEANRVKDEFLATLSHELRTPLNAILGYARMMRMGILAPGKQPRAIETIERNASSLTQIVEDVLDVSRIVSGKMRLTIQSVNLIAIVQQALEVVKPAADSKHIRLESAFATDTLFATVDPDRLQQVLWNILSNAVKFTPTGGCVSASVHADEEQIEIAIKDTGIGILPAFLPHVFERFRQQEAGTNRERGGLGIGLSIARELVEMHGGRIYVESEGLDHGSTFRIILPTTISNVAVDEAASHGASAAGAHRLVNLQGLRILAVDDDPDALALVREILENAGAELMLAASGAEALDALNRSVPDVIVSDIAMPKMDGFQLISEIRTHANPSVRAIPAAALTAYTRSEDSARARRSGFQRHLAKPIDPAELTVAVALLAGRPAA
jgi:PAS domain S-box-containing protein